MQTEETNNLEYNAPNLKETIEPSQSLIKPTPDNPPWNSWTAFGIWAASVIFIIVLPMLFVFPYLFQQGVTVSDSKQLNDFLQKDTTAIILNVIAIIPAHILTLVLCWLVVTRNKKFSFRSTLGWQWGGFTWWNCLLILGGFFAVAAIVSNFLPQPDNDLMRILRSSRTAVYIVAFMATFTAPIVEEVIYRGILYSAFQRTFGVFTAVFVVTALFALVHVPQYYPSYSTIILICLLSLILTLIRVRTKNLLPCIVLHTIFNGLQSLILVFEPFLTDYANQSQSSSAAIIHLLM
ncbi:MAG TPA: type II CAAX endopeptidase family protein [Pyrinomonadaceae bacterium]